MHPNSRRYTVELRCHLCSRGLDVALDDLAKLPRPGARCFEPACGGVLFVAAADRFYAADPADIDWDRPKRGRPRRTLAHV